MTADKESLDAVLQAAEWFLRQESDSEPLSASERAEFFAWLKASPLHVREYLGVARAANCLPAVLQRSSATAASAGSTLDVELYDLLAARPGGSDERPGEGREELLRLLLERLPGRRGSIKDAG